MTRSRRSSLSLLLFLPLAVLGLRALAGDGAPVVSAPSPSPPPAVLASLAIDDRLVVADPVKQGAVTLYPVVDSKAAARPTGEFDLLRDALEAKTFTVEESGGGTVPTLMVRNQGSKPVLLVAGDVVKGGKQDRVITADLVVPPGGEPLDVAVNCVEHGRWSAGSTGHSFGYGGRGEGSLKKVVQVSKDQSATWSEVEKSNGRKAAVAKEKGRDADAQKLAPSTGTYIASLENPAIEEDVNPATASLVASLSARKDVVGVIVAVGDSITTAELFGHPGLFARSRDDLVRSFVLDGVGAEPAAAPPATDAAAFLRDALSAQVTTSDSSGAADTSELSSPASTAFDTKTKSGERIHFNAYAR